MQMKKEEKKKPEVKISVVSSDAKQKKAEQSHVEKPIDKAKREAKEYYDKWLYLNAEFENYKKRSLKEHHNSIKYGNESFARELVEVVDSLELALAHVKEEDSGLVKGIQVTLKQFFLTFKKFGIEPVESVGKQFDPAVHQALVEQESDQEPGTVLIENYKGYKIHDRLLRSAKVIVAKKKGDQDVKK
jgi:molecular chaperone GrpE